MFRFSPENDSVIYATKWERPKCDPRLLTVLVPKLGLLKTASFGRLLLTSKTSNVH